ncbi:DUF72 domain-containing protein, partial [bacterium]|nr:DUF72 domain-containing protein [bacterium]
MARIHIGTAGWSYKDWEGIVYPQRKPQGFHPLLLLARFINIVEINSTFYRPPAIQMSLSWIKRVGDYPEFLFSIKLHQVFTHKRKGFTQKDIDTFQFGIEPLRAKSRLAAILIQFPWSFINTTAHIEYLINLFKSFADFPLALEIRHSSWNTSDFFNLLTEHKVCFCNIDQPIFRNSIKPSSISTNPEFSYVRLHGRNYENWFKKNAGRDERYNYLYAKEELEDWIKRIKELGNQSKKVFVITNNHYRGQALANALQIRNMITNEKLEIP